MVTKIENRKSQNEASNGADSKTAEREANARQSQILKSGKEYVAIAIKSRNESFGDLKRAAAYAFYALIDFGHTELANKLFNELPTIDADAIRQKFVAKIVDLFGAGGVWDESEEKWLTRPVSFIQFLATPSDGQKDQHFRVAKANDSETGKERQRLILEGRENVRKAGVEALEAIDWLTRAALMAKIAEYDINALKKTLTREFIKAAKASADADTHITKAQIRAGMRAFDFTKAEMALVELAMPQDTPKAETTPASSIVGETTLEKAA